jgi:2-polyprenyl-6-methoxyphenol hydroxylase-like FAD-dependent oxidoreductase
MDHVDPEKTGGGEAGHTAGAHENRPRDRRRSHDTAPVVIAGGGPVGLLLAAELGMRDVPVILFEENERTSTHPKANTHTSRALEIYRRHNISGALRSRGLPDRRPTDAAYFTTLFGHELHRVSLPAPADALAEARAGDTRWPTPEPQLRATQMVLEPLLLERARSFPSVEINYGWRVTGIDAAEAGVTVAAVQAATGQDRCVAAGYLVGCDGGKSFVRRHLGIRFLGEGGVELEFMGGRMLATYFRAPTLLRRFPHKPAWQHWTLRPGGRSVLLVIDPDADLFLVHVQLGPDRNAGNFDFAKALGEIVGEPIPHEVISAVEWRAGLGLVAERYRDGRCFLAGDAVHLFTPTGGFGLNTGIEDAFNLGWKLAATCNGWAPPELLDTYQQERRPIGIRNTRYALSLARHNGACPVSPDLDATGEKGEAARGAAAAHLARFARWEFDTPGIQLGARYDDSPIIAGSDDPPPEDAPTEYIPSAIPGGRLPHLWCRDGQSLYDKLGPEFTAIGIASPELSQAWDAASKETGIPLDVLMLAAEPDTRALFGADWLLVRPDQHIAWRGSGLDTPLADLLRFATGASSTREPTKQEER